MLECWLPVVIAFFIGTAMGGLAVAFMSAARGN